MLKSLVLLIAVALLPPDNHLQLSLDCVLQPGAEWSGKVGEISALCCEGVDGFFVESQAFRKELDPKNSEPYRLLDQELEDTKKELAIDEQIIRTSTVDEQLWKNGLDACVKGLKESDARATRSFWESPTLWFVGGVVTTLLVTGAVATVVARIR